MTYEKGLASVVYKVVGLNLYQIKNLQMNLIKEILENLKGATSILRLKTKFVEPILLMGI